MHRSRVLVLAPFAPRLDATHGGARAIAATIAGLARKQRVAVLYIWRPGEPSIDDALRQRCDLVGEIKVGGTSRWRRCVRVGWTLMQGVPLWVARSGSATFARRVQETARAWRPDVIQAEFHLMGQYFDAIRNYPALRVLVEHEPSPEAMPSAPGWMAPYEAHAWPRYERAVSRMAHGVVVFTERDARAMAPLAGDTPITVIPLGIEVPERAADPLGVGPPELLFVGNFVHPPNVDAAEWLAREILPLARVRCPQLSLQLVGDNVPARVRGLASGFVNVVGRVADVRTYYDRAAVVVAPLRAGGGMRVKVLEALAAGKAVVATRLAAAGLGVDDGEQVMLADSAEPFAAAVVDLVADPVRRAALAGRARAWACVNLGPDRSAEAYGALYARLAARTDGVGGRVRR